MTRQPTILQRAVKATAGAADRVRSVSSGVVVLAYHRVGGSSGLDVDLSLDAFEDQMAWLAESGRVIALDRAAAALVDGSGASDSVALTFDDGTADFADTVLPVLVRHGLPATVYVATRHIEDGMCFPDDGVPLSWSALADAVATGVVSVGSHTHGHRLLDRVDRAVAETELDTSVGLIRDRLGVDPRHFAYPKGLIGSPEAEAAVRERFVTAAVGGTRANVPGATDLHRLARSPIQVSDGWRWFERKVAGGMALEDVLRRLVNRARYARATT